MSNIIEQIKAAESAKLRALSSLHIELGYGSAQDLATAILEASVGERIAAAPRTSRTTSADTSAKTNGAARPKAARKGRRIDDEVKRQALAALEARQKGARVAKQFGVSYPTIHKWKMELELVKPRGRKASKK